MDPVRQNTKRGLHTPYSSPVYIHTGDKVEFNTVDFVESRLLPKPATNRQQSRRLPQRSTLLPIRSTLLPIRSTLSPVCTVPGQSDTVDSVASVYGTGPKRHGRLCRQCVRYRAKATRSTLSTFNKVDRVEFNFVASVYTGL